MRDSTKEFYQKRGNRFRALIGKRAYWHSYKSGDVTQKPAFLRPFEVESFSPSKTALG
jgi:hypothetical protein